ncbi:Vps51/Vps67-domain-containing protein, partial [Dipodascopsis uninucleata]
RASNRNASASAARRNALRAFYAIGQEEHGNGGSPSDIDRGDFKADAYIDKLVRENGVNELLAKENKLLHEIKTLDGEGKALVYDNYSKLISATQTIQKMRGSMDPLQPTTSALSPAIEHIAEVSTTLISTLSEKRKKMTILDTDANRKLTAKEKAETIRMILEAPNRISELMNAGEVGKAQQEWSAMEPALLLLSSFKGVDKIRQQCIDALE